MAVYRLTGEPPVPSRRTVDDFLVGSNVYFYRAISEKGEVIGIWSEVKEVSDTCVTIAYYEQDEWTGREVERRFSCIFTYPWLLPARELYWLKYDGAYQTEWLEDRKSPSSKFDQDKFLGVAGLTGSVPDPTT